MQTLKTGQNAVISASKIKIKVNYQDTCDVSSFRLYADNKTKNDDDFIFYGQTINGDKTITYTQFSGCTEFDVNINNLDSSVKKIAFSATKDNLPINNIGYLRLEVLDNSMCLFQAAYDLNNREEKALILCEVYKYNDQWKIKIIDQGFNGGLKPLAEYYGVDIADDEAQTSNPSQTPPTPPVNRPEPPEEKPVERVNLSKITLTKDKPKIDLEKKENIDLIRVNLNWNQGSGFWNKFMKKSIDLDLAAYISLKDGGKFIIQALGKSFGSFEYPPYVYLLGDDRTGSTTDGEWMHINGKQFDKIDEIVIFTFIYEGVANWGETDGKVKIFVPGNPEIETFLTDGSNDHSHCVIARISNKSGKICVERINRYYKSHKAIDKAFKWGFRWVSASK